MEQIFDWMRGHLEETANDVSPNTDKLVVLARVERLINEAETKWESECCEWKREKCLEFSLSDCVTSCGHTEHYSTGIDKYCRHCGKPIKISEVE